MDLSIKILDPDSTNIVDVGHFLFLGTESSKSFKAQIIDLDNDGLPYYIASSSSVDITFPTTVTVPGTILSNRSLVTVGLDDSQLSQIVSGDITIVIHEPSNDKVAFLGSCVRRILPLSTSSSSVSVTGQVKSSSDDGVPGFLGNELQVGTGLTEEVIDDPTYGKVVKISSTVGDQAKQTFNNNTGVTLASYRAVRLVGVNEIDYADNTSLTNAEVIGITEENISTGSSGDIALSGLLIATLSGVSSGDTLYLDSSNGQITHTPPSTPGTIIFKIGKYNSGTIYINFELIGVN